MGQFLGMFVAAGAGDPRSGARRAVARLGVSREHALSPLRPLDAALMISRPVSRLVNSVRNDGPMPLEPEEPLLLAS
jgi:hypothetical protein